MERERERVREKERRRRGLRQRQTDRIAIGLSNMFLSRTHWHYIVPSINIFVGLSGIIQLFL